ncbi:MAG: RnfABCDGE type electron transport complex subunit A [Bacteroidales bacterium]|nr:RnfABCDGE type electron transport complex subunit A [Bacteroidales bacterium]
MEYILLIIGAAFVNNIVLTQFLGVCPFLGVSSKVKTAMGMGVAVVFVITLATTVTNLVQHHILDPQTNIFGVDLIFLQTVLFILIIAALVQMIEIILKKMSPSLYQALGIFLPLMTTNCAVLGLSIMVIQNGYDLTTSVIFAAAKGLGFAFALVIFAGIREQMDTLELPKAMRGVPAALIVTGILALAFMGFAGLV